MNIGINNKTKAKINLSLIKKITEFFLLAFKKEDYEVSIAFVGDRAMRELNKTYRHLDEPTDVLSFLGKKGEKFFGEVIIDYAQVKRQAKKFKINTKQELIFILTHGLLHLLGYNDDTAKEQKEMEQIAKKFILDIKA